MTESEGPPEQLPLSAAAGGLGRALAATVAWVGAYFVLPLDRLAEVHLVVLLPAALVLFGLVVGLQVRAVVRAERPGVRAVEALGVCVPLFVVIFATTYFSMGATDAHAFTTHLSRLDALYFALTVFSTVGFGDITARSEAARAAVTLQMAADLVVVGVGVRVILGAIRIGRERRGVAPGSGA